MLKISVENFRSFEKSQSFEIKPITIFVGRNSSGKSTITRLVPLLQQTFEQRTSAPLLWNGALVDFGSFDEVRPKWKQDGEIVIGFDLPAPPKLTQAGGYGESRTVRLDNTSLKYRAFLAERKGGTRLTGFRINVGDDSIYIRISERRTIEYATINGDDTTELLASQTHTINNSSLFPYLRYFENSGGNMLYHGNYPPTINKLIEEALGEFFHWKTSQSRKSVVFRNIPYAQSSAFREILSRAAGASDYFKSKVLEKEKVVDRLRVLKFATAFTDILEYISRAVEQRFRNSAYIGPSRAAGERYYRWQELAVDRLDPKGENLAMYLMSLADSELASLNKLLLSSLRFQIKRQRLTGHASIMLAENDGDNWYNLADIGFGYSQILPVAAQIHSILRTRLRSQRQKFVAIEQPELHLHPALQSRLAKLFESAIYSSGDRGNDRTLSGVSIIAETHSEIFLNRIGEEVESGNIHSDDVIVYIFEKDGVNSQTRVKNSRYNSDGVLTNWPFGFFNDDN
jgi:hypothetical protein